MDPQISQPKKRWPLSRKMTIIIAAGLLAIIVIILIVVFATRNNSSEPQGKQNTILYDRLGYDRSKLGNGIADPFAVTFDANEQPVSYKGNKVIQACNLLGVEDLTKQDLLIKANTLPSAISRTYNDGVSKGAYTEALYGSSLSALGLGMDVNSCTYVLEDKKGAPSIGINVFQSFVVPAQIVDQEVKEKYVSTTSIEGLEVYSKKASSSLPGREKSEYIIRQQDKGAFYIAIELPSDKTSKKQSILETAAKKFIQEQSNPTGPKTLDYKSPVYSESFVHACHLLTNDAIRTLTGKDASPLAREGIASSIAILTFNDSDPYLNIRNECIRGTTSEATLSLAADFQLSVEATSYLSDKPAKQWIEAQKHTNPNNRGSIELPGKVGDDGVAYTDASGGQHVIFSKDRFVVDVWVSKISMAQAGIRNLSTAAEKLTPIAQSMADRIKE